MGALCHCEMFLGILNAGDDRDAWLPGRFRKAVIAVG
jgi:hypothetical protein